MKSDNLLKEGNKLYLPNLSIDLVIIGYDNHALKCLLLEIGEKWVLPGGYIQHNESVDEAAQNILKNRTGLENPHLKFLSVFGDKNRQFKDLFKKKFEEMGEEWSDDYWFTNRFVSLVYYSLVDMANTHPSVGHFDEDFAWFDFNELPEMWMDHKNIAQSVRQQIKKDVKHELMTYNLLAEEFTMPELHELHQTILEEKIDRSRFQKNMLASGLFKRLPKLQNKTPGRNPYKYKLVEKP